MSELITVAVYLRERQDTMRDMLSRQSVRGDVQIRWIRVAWMGVRGDIRDAVGVGTATIDTENFQKLTYTPEG